MSSQLRVTGHGLKDEGRVLDDGPVGRAVCQCGWQSNQYATDHARKAAHRAHKLEVLRRLRDAT